MPPPRLQLSGVAKAFGPTQALRSVSLTVEAGEVHAIIGENGAGKSTLMKILSGVHAPDAGTLHLDGRPFQPRNPLEAKRQGIAMIYQELTLVPHLSVAENILLGDESHRGGWILRRRQHERARAALAELQADHLPLDAAVGDLTIAQQQLVEIARAMLGAPRVLIMDEPTSSLTRVDVERLFTVMARLRDHGVSLLYISHFLEECQQVCDRYTVLRDGETVDTGAMRGADLGGIIQQMVGRAVKDLYPRTDRQPGATVLTVNRLSGREKPRGASFEVRAGEIFGLAGLIGAGRTETLRTLFGLDRLKAGTVAFAGTEASDASPHHRWEQGIGYLSENRKEEGLMLNRPLADNLLLTCPQPLATAGWIHAGAWRAAADHWIGVLKVKAAGADQFIGELSGGNQQKIALGRLLYHDARLLLLDEPTRGIDVGSKADIYRRMGEAAAGGKAVIFVSSYLPELLGVCDTIGVMCRGELVAVKPVSEWTEHAIIAAATGATAPADPARAPASIPAA